VTNLSNTAQLHSYTQ